MSGALGFDLARRLGLRGPADPGVHGFPQLKSGELVGPSEFQLIESAFDFKELVVSRAVRVFVPGERRILRGVPMKMSLPGAEQISRKLFIPSVNGILDLPAPGSWWLNTPIVTAEGTPLTVVYSDAAAAVADSDSEDPWVAKFDPRTMLAPPVVANVTNASALALAARVGRRFLYVIAHNFAGGATRVTLTFTTPAVSLRGFHMLTGQEKTWDALDGISEQAVYAITDIGTADLYFIEGV